MNSMKVRRANYDTMVYKVDMEYLCSKMGLDHSAIKPQRFSTTYGTTLGF